MEIIRGKSLYPIMVAEQVSYKLTVTQLVRTRLNPPGMISVLQPGGNRYRGPSVTHGCHKNEDKHIVMI